MDAVERDRLLALLDADLDDAETEGGKQGRTVRGRQVLDMAHMALASRFTPPHVREWAEFIVMANRDSRR